MKFFVTGRSSNYNRVIEAFDKIEASGNEVTLRWTDFPMIKPYSENSEKAGEYSIQQLKGIAEADVFILFAHEDGTGVFTEFGAALIMEMLNKKLKIFAIGNDDVKGKAMFHFHPIIQWRSSVDEIISEVTK
ncbi:hypothetical protein KC845_00195 [Candidatus Kaiserbacteria bacterium]|nr:hypothetical protein [Candidatus Kaiserbacteria bacterium]